MAAKQKAQKNAQPKNKALPMMLILVGVVGVVAPPSLMVLLVGMIPSLAAIFISPVRAKGATASMFSLNLAGVIPVLCFLWERGQTFDNAIRLLTDVYMWGLMFGSAGLAAFLIWGIPIGVHAMYEIQAKTVIGRLQKRRQRLIEEWGGQILDDSKIMPAEKKKRRR